jgi:hypothetical protein
MLLRLIPDDLDALPHRLHEIAEFLEVVVCINHPDHQGRHGGDDREDRPGRRDRRRRGADHRGGVRADRDQQNPPITAARTFSTVVCFVSQPSASDSTGTSLRPISVAHAFTLSTIWSTWNDSVFWTLAKPSTFPAESADAPPISLMAWAVAAKFGPVLFSATFRPLAVPINCRSAAGVGGCPLLAGLGRRLR